MSSRVAQISHRSLHTASRCLRLPIAATFECNICSIHHLVRTRLLAYNFHQLTSRSSDQHPAPTNTLLTRYHADGYIAHRG